MDVIEHGAAQQGTFNGNPLVVAPPGSAALTEVLTPDAYDALDRPRRPAGRRAAGKAIAEHGIPAHTVDLGCQGLRVVPAGAAAQLPRLPRDHAPSSSTASYPWVVNRGVFMTPGDEEQWTMSVQHTDADIDRYVGARSPSFAAAVERLTVPGVVHRSRRAPRRNRRAQRPTVGDAGAPGRREEPPAARGCRNGMVGEPELGERGRDLLARHPRRGGVAEPRSPARPRCRCIPSRRRRRRSGRSAAGGRT